MLRLADSPSCLVARVLTLTLVASIGWAATSPSADFQRAIEKPDLPAAWRLVADWKDASPADPVPRVAETELYLKLNAPAAAIASANAGLALVDDTHRATERSLLALKAQAHLAVDEPAPAWAAFSRVLARSNPAETNDPLVALARRARWDAFVQISSYDSHSRFRARLAAATTAPQAPASAHVRLAHYAHSFESGRRAVEVLHDALQQEPQSPILRAAFADFFLAALVKVAGDFAEKSGLLDEFAASLSLVRQAPEPDPLAALLIAQLAETSTPPSPARVPPKNLSDTVKTFASNLNERRTRQMQAIQQAGAELVGAEEQAAQWRQTPPRTAAEIDRWESKVLAAARALAPAQAEWDRMADTVAFLLILAEERAGSAAGGSADQATLAEIRKVAAIPDEQIQIIHGSDDARARLPSLVAELRHQRRGLAALERLTAAKTPAEQLAATDDVLATVNTSATMWRVRSKAAAAAEDPVEALTSGARAFVAEWMAAGADFTRELPPSTRELLEAIERTSAEASALVTRAVAAWKAGQAESALSELDRALALDPAQPDAWRHRWEWCEAGGDLSGAAIALERWWRLDTPGVHDRSSMFEIAVRAGAWELLLSLADAGLAIDPRDTEAIYFRAHAALALNRLPVAREALSLAAVSVQAAATKPLSVALACIDPKSPSPDYQTLKMLETPAAPAGLAVLVAGYNHTRRTANTGTKPIAAKGMGPSNVHVDRLEGRLSQADYLTRTRGTTEEPMAAFVEFFISDQGPDTPATLAAARSIADDARLPLAIRALAHRRRVEGESLIPVASLRASDLHYASRALGDQWWGAPGQEVLLDGSVHPSLLPREYPARFRGLDSTPPQPLPTTAPTKELRPRLVELRNLTIQGALTATALPPAQAPIVIAQHVNFTGATSLAIAGFARFEGCFFDAAQVSVGREARLELRGVQGRLNGTQVEGRLVILGGRLVFGSAPVIGAGGSVDVREADISGGLPFTLTSGGTAVWQNVTAQCDLPWPSPLPAGWSIRNSRVAAASPGATQAILPLPAPHSGQLNVLAAVNSEPTKRVRSIQELENALRSAAPGATIELGAGDHALEASITIPAGVTLLAAPACKIIVARHVTAAFVFPQAGAAALRNVHNEVHSGRAPGATSTTEVTDTTPKTALTVGRDAWVIVRGGSLYRWHHTVHTPVRVASGGRLELRDFTPGGPSIVQPGGQLVLPRRASPPAATLRAEIAQRTRDEQWQAAAARYESAIARARNRAERVEATRRLGEVVAQTARITGVSRPDATRRYVTLAVSVMQRFPAESPQILFASNAYELGDDTVVKELVPRSLHSYFTTFVNSYNEAQRLGVNLGTMDNIYDLMLAYPPGSANHAVAQKAMKRNLSVAQFEEELAAQRQRELQVAAALQKQREAEAKKRAEESKRAVRFAQSSGQPAASTAARWTSSNYSPPSYSPPAWTPSESYKMQVYRQNLDVQIRSVTRR